MTFKLPLQQLFLGKLVTASSWLVIGGMAGGMLGYIFHIIMGRMLSVAEYGTFTALMAVMLLTGAPLSTLSMLVSRKVSAYRLIQFKDHRSYLFFSIIKKILLISMVLIVTLLFFSEPFQRFLTIDKYEYYYLLIAMLVIAFPQSINNAYLQGLQFFKWLSVSGVLSTLLKIVVSVLLVYAGFGVSGALGGVVISSVGVLILTCWVLRPFLGKVNGDYKDIARLSYKRALPVFLANVAFVAMTQIDMVMVKYFFSDQDVGLYAAASILGKAVMYLPGGIVLALFPMVAENDFSGESSVYLLFQAVGITALLCTIGALFYYFFSDLIIVFLYGEEYKQAAKILQYFGFAMFPMALIMVAEHYLIAMGRVLFAYLFVIVIPFQLLAIYYYHETLLDIVAILFISGTTLVLLGYGLLWRAYKNGKTVA